MHDLTLRMPVPRSAAYQTALKEASEWIAAAQSAAATAAPELPQDVHEETEEEMALVDSRIRVWWTEEKAWYAGRVVSIERGAGGNLNTTVAYDDGSTETHDLGVEAWEAWEAEPAPKCKTPTGRYRAANASTVLTSPLASHDLEPTSLPRFEFPNELTRVSSTAPVEEAEADRVSRKDKSLGLLCDNFLQLFACGFSATVELEPVANRLGVGRRRIYDIVNVLESLDVVQKDRASSYTWFGLTQLPRRLVHLEAVSAGAAAAKLLPDCPLKKDNIINAGGTRNEDEHEGCRKEKSIKELSFKFVGLFLQVHARY